MKINALLFLLVLLFVVSCSKKRNKVYTISGRLLESSTNPVPVRNYKLSLYQMGSTPIPAPIITSSSSAVSTTNTEGYFEFRYTPGEGIFIVIPTTNNSPISIMSDYSNPNPISLYWAGLPAKTDTSLQSMYLFKLVKNSIIKVKPVNQVNVTDTIIVQADTKTGLYKKSITGITIPASSETVVDTIYNVIFTDFDFNKKNYRSTIMVYKKGSFPNYNQFEPPLDETQKIYSFTIFN